jgi:protease-4
MKNKLHVNVTPVKSNKHADMYTFMRPLDESEKNYFQDSVEDIYTQFTSIVAEGRDMTVADVDEIAQGRVWTGAEALGIGLVDEIGTIEDALAYAALSIDGVYGIEDVQIVEYPKPMTTLEMLLESLQSSDTNVFSGTALENVAEAFISAKENLHGKVYARLPFDMIAQ